VLLPENPRLATVVELIENEDHSQAAATAQTLLGSNALTRQRDSADTHYCLALALLQLNHHAQAQSHFDAALDAYAALGDREWELRCEANLARLHERVGDLETCQHLAQRVIKEALEGGFAYPLNYARLILGYCFQRRRDYKAAEPLFLAAESYFRNIRGDEALVLRCWEGLAWVWNAMGRRSEARPVEEQIIAAQRKRRQPIALATSLTAIGFGAWLDGDLERMRKLLDEVLLIASAHKHERLLMSTHNNLAIISVELGDWEAVRKHAALALLHASRSGDSRRPPLAYGLQLHLAIFESRPVDALHYAEEAILALSEHSSAEAQQFELWRPIARLAGSELQPSDALQLPPAPEEASIEQIIQQRWLLRALDFITSSRFRPDLALSEECLQQARDWAARVRAWLDSAPNSNLPERWKQY
jgi:tetratricopeptide (TPR) repeat protein